MLFLSGSKLRIFQDDLLYTGSSKLEEDAEDFLEVKDVDLLRFDIEQLTLQRDALLKDNKRCAYFLYDQCCSEALHYKYLTMKLQHARYFAHGNKNQGMGGQYLSKILDLRSELLHTCDQQRQLLEISLNNLQNCQDQLRQDAMQLADSLSISPRNCNTIDIDEIAKNSETGTIDSESLSIEEKLHHFDEHLQRISQNLKPFSASMKKSLKEAIISEETENRPDNSAQIRTEGIVQTIFEGTSTELKKFQQDSQARMDACFQKTVLSLQKRQLLRQELFPELQPQNNIQTNRFQQRLQDISDDILAQQQLLRNASAFKTKQREDLLSQHERDLKHPDTLVNDYRAKFLNKLKVMIFCFVELCLFYFHSAAVFIDRMNMEICLLERNRPRRH
jgi:hypothetical protein